MARFPRAADVARKDVPTCSVEERLGDVAERVKGVGWDVCVVVNEERIVFGLLRSKELMTVSRLRVVKENSEKGRALGRLKLTDKDVV